MVAGILLIFVSQASAQAEVPASRERIFLSPLAEAVYYGRHSPAAGGGLSLGYGDTTAWGLRALFGSSFFDDEKLTVLEVLAFFRFSFFQGLFVQLNTGLVVFYADNSISLPSDSGSFSAGVSVGWRFLLGEKFFLEPYVRGGYPYYGGLGLCAGVRL